MRQQETLRQIKRGVIPSLLKQKVIAAINDFQEPEIVLKAYKAYHNHVKEKATRTTLRSPQLGSFFDAPRLSPNSVAYEDRCGDHAPNHKRDASHDGNPI